MASRCGEAAAPGRSCERLPAYCEYALGSSSISVGASNFSFYVPYRLVRRTAAANKGAGIGHAARKRRIPPCRSQRKAGYRRGLAPECLVERCTHRATIHRLHQSLPAGADRPSGAV